MIPYRHLTPPLCVGWRRHLGNVVLVKALERVREADIRDRARVLEYLPGLILQEYVSSVSESSLEQFVVVVHG